MRGRRFLLLAATLVALNVALWIVPQGLALQQVVVAKLFGKSMVRAQVKETNGQTWHVDRGVVVTNSPGTLSLVEADGGTADIVTSSSTRVIGTPTPIKLKAVKPGWRVVVSWVDPNGPAATVQVEKRGSSS